MKFGLSTLEYALVDKLLFTPLKKRKCKVWVFGSRARGDHKAFSDLDILYENSELSELSLGELSQIKEDLEESELPYKVDIVNFDEVAESYRDGISKDRIEVL
jgi:predicted nucleotidyltransferase